MPEVSEHRVTAATWEYLTPAGTRRRAFFGQTVTLTDEEVTRGLNVGALGVELPADALDRMLAFNESAPPAMKPSMALDLERGNRIELPWLGGKVVELGRQLGVPTPTHALMHAALKPYVMGSPA